MSTRIAAIVTFQDLKAYFQGDRNNDKSNPDVWRTEIDNHGEFWAYTKAITFNAFPEGVTYRVEVHAKEDPSDSDSTVTDQPAKFIADFLSTGGAGDEFFNRRSSSPEGVAETLRTLSTSIEEDVVGPRQTVRILRRLVAKTTTVAIENPSVDTYDVQMEHIEKLKSELSDKGWQVESGLDNRKLPKLMVEVGDEYEATISVDSIQWNSTVIVKAPDGDNILRPEAITTDDPIKSYQKLRRSDQVKKFLGESNEADPEAPTEYDMGTGRTQAPDSADNPTKAPKAEEEQSTYRPTKPSKEKPTMAPKE